MPRTACTLALALTLARASTAGAGTVVVHSGESIQTAVDAAPAGTTIRVEPGTYHEAGDTRAVTVTEEGIRLVGAARPGRPVVLEQSGTQTQGIWVSPADALAPTRTPASTPGRTRISSSTTTRPPTARSDSRSRTVSTSG